jgi:hypothetical protein
MFWSIKMESFEIKSARGIAISLSILTCLFLLRTPLYSGQGEVLNLRSGTPVVLKVQETITSETAILNQIVKLKVATEVNVDDSVVIPYGADAHGKITKIVRPKASGQKGELRMTVISVTAIDRTQVLLSVWQSTTGKVKDDRPTAVSVCTGPPCIPIAAIPAGAEIKVYVNGDHKIRKDVEGEITR